MAASNHPDLRSCTSRYAGIGGRGLLSLLVAALGGTPYTHRAVLVRQASEMLATAEAERGRRVVFVVDESHLLVRGQLEDLHMLTSADMDSRSPAAVLLIGQPTLGRRLHQGSLAAIDQRVTLRVHLDGITLPPPLPRSPGARPAATPGSHPGAAAPAAHACAADPRPRERGRSRALDSRRRSRCGC